MLQDERNVENQVAYLIQKNLRYIRSAITRLNCNCTHACIHDRRWQGFQKPQEFEFKLVICSLSTCSVNGHTEHSVDLHNRSRVEMSSPEMIVAYAGRDYHRGDKCSIIHGLSRDWQLCRPHAEKDEYGQVNAGKRVERYTVYSWYVPMCHCRCCYYHHRQRKVRVQYLKTRPSITIAHGGKSY